MVLPHPLANLRRRGERAAGEAADALDARLPLYDAEAKAGLLRKAFPDHWSFLLGELALYSFVLLLLTGVYLTLFFDPGMSETVYHGSYAPLDGIRVSQAYASTLHISFDVRGGLLIRQIHHWAAVLFVAAIGLHMLRVFFTGAFRRPRELNWVFGVTLFLLALLEGFCGYSLPDDLLSGTGLRTAEGIVLSIPIVGSYLQMFLFGGEFPGHSIIPRLYVTHILLVPGLLLALVVVHLVLVFYLKHTQWAGPGRTNRNVVGMPLFPQFTARSVGLMLCTFGVLTLLGGLAQINPVWMYGPYVSHQASTDAQPDWYVGFLEGAMRLMPALETHFLGHTVVWDVFLPAVVLPALLFLILYSWPFVERRLTGDTREHHLCDRPRDHPARTAFGAAAVTCYAVLLIAGGQDVVSDTLHVSVNGLNWTLRICFVLAPITAFWVAKRFCLALQAHDRELLTEGEETGLIVQTVEGGFEEPRSPLDAARAYAILARDHPPEAESAGADSGERAPGEPEPAEPGGVEHAGAVAREAVAGAAPNRALDRVTLRLRRWYLAGAVAVPLDERTRRAVARVTAPPPPPGLPSPAESAETAESLEPAEPQEPSGR